MHHLIQDIGIAVIAAMGVGFIFHLLKQPVILGYLVAGALIGPEMGLKLISEPDSIEVISEIGLILLLFIIGLEINPPKFLTSGKSLIIAGIGQFFLTVLIGIGFFLLLGFGLGEGNIDALYLAIFCGISSTAIVVKLLYDKFELDTMAGRLSLGILIFQDIWAILILAFQPNFTDPQLIFVAMALGKGVILLLAAWLLSKYVIRWIFEKISKTPELVVAMAIAWCGLVTTGAEALGLSKEMGALIAGVSISTFPYSIHVTAKVLPLRDFFLTLFFLSLGMRIPIPEGDMIKMMFIIAAFAILTRFIIIYPLLSLSGSGRRTSFITSLNLSQISEFSLVIGALGVTYGHIEVKLLSTIIYAMALTSVLSTYFIKGNHAVYQVFDNLVSKMGFPQKLCTSNEAEEPKKRFPVVVLGYHRGAAAMIKEIEQTSKDLLSSILVIDFNLEVLKEINSKGMHGVFGDISSLDTLEHTHLEDAQVIVSTIPDMLLKGTNNVNLVQKCRSLNPNAIIVATADSPRSVEQLKVAGANEVILPYTMVGEKVANLVKQAMS